MAKKISIESRLSLPNRNARPNGLQNLLTGKVRLDGYKSKGFKNTEVGMMQQLLTGKIKLV